MSSWCPLPTIRPVRGAKLLAHRQQRNVAVGNIDISEVTESPDLVAEHVDERAQRPTTIAAIAGIGAGAIHAAAIGVHADHPLLANAFVVLAVAQLGGGIALLTHPGRALAKATIVVNAAAVVGWVVSRLVGVWFIAGLEVAEPPEFADTVCALLGALAAVGAALAVQVDTRLGPTRTWRPDISARDIALPAIAVLVLALPAMSLAATHAHAHDDVPGDSHSHEESIDDDEPVDENLTVAGEVGVSQEDE